ncbi:hypothetical protein N7486_000015 [Penicillium sp. IBT 16267x]|nr:hypothetical protein N7486_000015 [Penicillium sp. IBT 16267x]
MSERTFLDRLEKLCNVDIDGVDTAFITSLPFKPHNLTSNQQVICNAMLANSNREIFTDMVDMHGDQGWEAVFDRMAVQLVKNNLEYITGRVLLQISPRYINNKDSILQHCYRLTKYFHDAGISKDRFAIKLPFTGAAACAAAEMNGEGIRTLATSVFGLEQAIAASQSECLFISPYYNGKEQPIMVIASHLSTAEVMAMAELGCQHVTITEENMKALLQTPDSLTPVTTSKPTYPYANLITPARLKCLSRVDSLSPAGCSDILPSGSTNYLANDGRYLDEAIQADGFVAKGLKDAMDWFIAAEEKAKHAIEREILMRKESASATVATRLPITLTGNR